MSKPDPPAAPNYTQLAEQQGQANIDAAKLTNPNVVTPYGTQTVSYSGPVAQTQSNFDPQAYLKANPDIAGKLTVDPWTHYQNWGITEGRAFTPIAGATGNMPTVTQTLSPEQQHLLDQQNQMKGLLGGLGIQGAQSLQGIVGTPLNLSGVPAMPKDSQTLRNQMIDAAMSRVNEDYGRQQADTNSNMVAAGLHPGSKAYDAQMNLLNRGVNDARQQAILNAGTAAQQAYGMDMQSRQQGLSELLAQRQVPLNEITALMSGSQASNPFQAPAYTPMNVQATPYMQAGQLQNQYNTDLYNVKAAQQGNLQQGLFGLAGAGLNAYGMSGPKSITNMYGGV